MKKRIATIVFLAFCFCLAAISTGWAQESKPKMRQEIVRLKYVKNNQILNVLYTFISREGKLNPSPDSGLLTISDYPENVEKILSVIREYDVKPADIQFTIQLLLGSLTGEEKTDWESLGSDAIIKQLRSLLQYKSFSLLDSSYIRALDRGESEVTMGKEAELRLILRPTYVLDGKENLIQVEARLSKVLLTGPDLAKNLNTLTLLTSNFTMKSGEKTVVGVSKMDGGDKALILIISGKIVD